MIQGTSFGEASSRTQATDPNRRETLRIRTPLPGLRVGAKWLRTVRYVVKCQSSNERGVSSGYGTLQVHAAGEGRRAMDSDSPGRSMAPPQALFLPVRGTR